MPCCATELAGEPFHLQRGFLQLPVSLLEVPVGLFELPVSLFELPVSLRKSCIQFQASHLLLDLRLFGVLGNLVQCLPHAARPAVVFTAGILQPFIPLGGFSGLLHTFLTHLFDLQFVLVNSFGVLQHQLPQLRHV